MSDELARLCRSLRYEFAADELLEAALTHRSSGSANNERLEFLGDAVLGMVVAEALYAERPNAREGELSRLRASLVRKETLAQIAGELRLGRYLRLGPGELKSGGFRRDSILADALEAVIGAIYLDGGFAAARACILRLQQDRLGDLPDAADLKDPKSQLQELLQARGLPVPAYALREESGDAHRRRFSVSCEVAELSLLEHGEGGTRQRAEQRAASRVLDRLSETGDSKTESAPSASAAER